MSAVRFTDVVPPPPRAGWPGPISFEVEEGTMCLFATTPGVSLTLIRLMVGLREPAEGTVDVLEQRPGRLNRWDTQAFRRRLGVGFDEPSGLVSNLTLRMNLVVPMLYSGLADADTAHEKARAMIDACELGRWADRRPADVPPEVRKEAVVARALVRDPELLLLEEPTAGLREERAGWLLSRCRERAKTIVITTAEREGVQFETADTVMLLDNTGIETTSHEVGVV
jgi:ABC-type multidrug transport system ATPase subunit